MRWMKTGTSGLRYAFPLTAVLVAAGCGGPDAASTAQDEPVVTTEFAEASLTQQDQPIGPADSTAATPSGCTNWTYRVGGLIGCCDRTTMRYQLEQCIYGTWYPTNRSVCRQTTSYCSLCGPNKTSC